MLGDSAITQRCVKVLRQIVLLKLLWRRVQLGVIVLVSAAAHVARSLMTLTPDGVVMCGPRRRHVGAWRVVVVLIAATDHAHEHYDNERNHAWQYKDEQPQRQLSCVARCSRLVATGNSITIT
jgi:hypothetical protein